MSPEQPAVPGGLLGSSRWLQFCCILAPTGAAWLLCTLAGAITALVLLLYLSAGGVTQPGSIPLSGQAPQASGSPAPAAAAPAAPPGERGEGATAAAGAPAAGAGQQLGTAALLDDDSYESAELAALDAYEARVASQQASAQQASAQQAGAAGQAALPRPAQQQAPAAGQQQQSHQPCQVQVPPPPADADIVDLTADSPEAVPVRHPRAGGGGGTGPGGAAAAAAAAAVAGGGGAADVVDLLDGSPTKRRHGGEVSGAGHSLVTPRRSCHLMLLLRCLLDFMAFTGFCWHAASSHVPFLSAAAGGPGRQARQAQPRGAAAAPSNGSGPGAGAGGQRRGRALGPRGWRGGGAGEPAGKLAVKPDRGSTHLRHLPGGCCPTSGWLAAGWHLSCTLWSPLLPSTVRLPVAANSCALPTHPNPAAGAAGGDARDGALRSLLLRRVPGRVAVQEDRLPHLQARWREGGRSAGAWAFVWRRMWLHQKHVGSTAADPPALPRCALRCRKPGEAAPLRSHDIDRVVEMMVSLAAQGVGNVSGQSSASSYAAHSYAAAGCNLRGVVPCRRVARAGAWAGRTAQQMGCLQAQRQACNLGSASLPECRALLQGCHSTHSRHPCHRLPFPAPAADRG